VNELPVAAAGNGLFILILLVGLFWFLLVMPNRRRQRAQKQLLSQVQVGEEVVTVGGLIGRVVEAGETELRVEIADGVVVRVSRRAVAGILPGDEPAEEAETPEPPYGDPS